MSYEIPQSLKYKEKIIFNLTLNQLIYAVVFGLSSFFIYAKTPLLLEVKITFISVLVSLGLAFMYGDLFQRVYDLWSWFKFRGAKKNTAKMQKYIGLKAIEKNCYIISDKISEKKVAVLSIEPINFKIKQKDERESIIYSFQKFLNGLDFPIQIVMYSDNLNLNNYLDELDSKIDENSHYKVLLDSHKNHINAEMKEKVSANRKFYVVIKENDVGLDSQLKVVKDLCSSLGLRSKRVWGKQLAKLLIKLFKNELPEKNKDLYDFIAPQEIKNKKDYFLVNKQFNRIITAVGYPRSVEQGFLDKIITTAGNFDLSIHIEPFPMETTMVMLNKEIQKQRADLYSAQMKNQFSPSLEIQYKDTKGVLNSIQKGKEKLFHVSLYINIKAKDEKELKLLTKTIESLLNSILIIPKIPKYKQAQGLRSILPFGNNELAIRRNITTFALSAFFPFTSPFLMMEEGGVFLGLNKNKLPIIKDIFSLSNANGAILATSGGGKSYTAKLIISRYLMSGTKVMVIDPQNEYTKLTEMYKGSVIDISRKSKTIINPLDLLGHSYDEKRLALMDLFQIIFGDMSEIQKAVLDKALTKTYDKKGITQDHYKNKVPPKLGDLYDVLEKLTKKASKYEKRVYIALLSRLNMYVHGVFSFLNTQTNLDVDNNFITFNIGNMPKQIKPVMMFLILDYLYARMKQDKERKLLIIDEAWSLLQNAGEEGYIFEVVKTCRKFNLGLLLITQDVADLVNSKAGRAVLANSSYTILLRQKTAVIRSMNEVFNLSKVEKERLLTARPGEGILMMENDHQEIQFISSPEEHKIITTKADEIVEEENGNNKTQDMTLDLDLSKGYYKKNQLKPEEIHFLLTNQYEESRHVPIGATTHSKFLVKKVGYASKEHTFLLHAVYEEIKKHTDNVEIDESSRKESINPDIIFKDNNGKEIALEIETGVNLKHNKEYFTEKVKRLNDKYGQDWYIILTSARWLSRYKTAFGDRVFLRDEVVGHIDRYIHR